LPLARLSLFFAGVLGLGLWLFPKRTARGERPPGGLYVAGVLGLALSQLPCYLGASAAGSVRWTVAVGGPAFAVAAWRAWRRGRQPRWSSRAAVLGAIAIYPAFKILTEPLVAWDARSIWFFQGKIIFLSPAGLLTSAWAKAELAFSHPDYPKLIPLLGAQAGALAGFWNDHWPKLGLLVLLALFQLGLHALPFGSARAWLAGLVVFIVAFHLLWNGYADGYLAAFTLLAILGLGRFLLDPGPRPLWLAAGSLGILSQLKNEGGVLAIVLVGLFAWAALRGGRLRAALRAWDWRMGLCFLPAALWVLLKARYGLRNDLVAGLDWSRAVSRLADPGFWRLVARHYFGSPLIVVLPLFAGAISVSWRLRRWRLNRGAELALAAFAVYSAALVFAYALSYWPLEEHLATAMFRLAQSLATLLLAAFLLGLAELQPGREAEAAGGRSSPGREADASAPLPRPLEPPVRTS
jgi:hypothetical protein